MSSLSTRKKHKAFERALRRTFSAIPAHFKYKVHTSITDSYNSIEVPSGTTLPSLADLETAYNDEVSIEETAVDVDTSGDFQVGIANLYVDISTSRVGIGKTNPDYTLDVVGNIKASGDLIAFSDERLKNNIETIPNALEKILQLRGVTFTKIDGDNRRHVGVIAQEVENVLPEVVYTDENGMKSVAYGNLVALLIEAIKELSKSR